VLELIWAAVEIAIHIHMNNKNIILDDVIDGNNIALKVWLQYYRLAGY